MKRALIDLSIDPRVYTVDKFITTTEATHMISLGMSHGMERAVVSGTKKGVLSKGRTNDVAWVDHTHDACTRQISARVSGLVGIPLSHAERFQVIHYGEGAEYRPHFDAFDPKTPSGKRTWQGGGQRLITALCYLNTPPRGGGTIFPKLGFRVPAEACKLVVFHNCIAGGIKRHPNSLHGGEPVEAGEKWAFNLWFRANPRR